jgi:hypothetical protein
MYCEIGFEYVAKEKVHADGSVIRCAVSMRDRDTSTRFASCDGATRTDTSSHNEAQDDTDQTKSGRDITGQDGQGGTRGHTTTPPTYLAQ